MLIDKPELSDISQAISIALAPAFVLAAIAGLVSGMTLILFRTQDRAAALARNNDAAAAWFEARSRALIRCVKLMLGSALCIVAYVILVFAMTIFGVHYERVVLNVFLLAFVLLLAALGLYLREFHALGGRAAQAR